MNRRFAQLSPRVAGRHSGLHSNRFRFAAALLGTALLGAAATSQADTVTKPSDDPFYVQPNPLPHVAHGTLLGSREVSFEFDGSFTPFPLIPLPTKVKAWQIQYATTDNSNQPVMNIATVLIPSTATADSPLLSYQTATDSDTLNFSSSYAMRTGAEIEGALFGLGMAKGWKVVVPDFEGLHAEYTAGRQAGHSTLDAILATEQLSEAQLKGIATPVVMWGYSGGAQATAWAAELQPSYAPQLNIVGIAEGGVPVNIGNVARLIDGGPFAGVFFAAVTGIARAYNVDMKPYLNAKGQKLISQVANESITGAILSAPFKKINDYVLPQYQNVLSLPQFQTIIADDSLAKATPTAPLFIYGGTVSDLIYEPDSRVLAQYYCKNGGNVKLEFYPGDHFVVAVSGAPEALHWLTERLAGQSVPDNCNNLPAPDPVTLPPN
ncbi:MAG: lipase family protein [Nevskia sp.]|nr:lipase family protein [Nevskia sp.]